MGRKQQRLIQTCSHCQKTGHNKRTCPFVASEHADDKSKKPFFSREKEKKSHSSFDQPERGNAKNASVFVRMTSQAVSSPHVVDLRDKKAKFEWKNIATYREKEANVLERQAVDFAEMVRKANTAPAPVRQTAQKPIQKKEK